MGRIVGERTHSAVGSANVGDLILWAFDSARAIGIVLEAEESKNPLVGMLISSFELPRVIAVQGDTACVNYGGGWLLEPVESDATRPGYFEVSRRAGLLVLTGDGWFMNFATSYPDALGRFNWQWFNLTDQSVVRELERGVPYDEWKLWLSAEERDHLRGIPLVNYKAVPLRVER